MKIPVQTYIAAISAPQEAPPGDIFPVIVSLEDAGFELVVGSLSVRPDKPLQPTAHDDARGGWTAALALR